MDSPGPASDLEEETLEDLEDVRDAKDAGDGEDGGWLPANLSLVTS
jgi:hypothetical protein